MHWIYRESHRGKYSTESSSLALVIFLLIIKQSIRIQEEGLLKDIQVMNSPNIETLSNELHSSELLSFDQKGKNMSFPIPGNIILKSVLLESILFGKCTSKY